MAEIFTKTEKCPQCGSEKRVLGPLFQELVKNKPKLIQDQAPKGIQLQVPLQFAINTLMTKCPVLVVTFEICADCHTMYALSGDLADAPVQVQNIPGGKLPPHMGRG